LKTPTGGLTGLQEIFNNEQLADNGRLSPDEPQGATLMPSTVEEGAAYARDIKARQHDERSKIMGMTGDLRPKEGMSTLAVKIGFGRATAPEVGRASCFQHKVAMNHEQEGRQESGVSFVESEEGEFFTLLVGRCNTLWAEKENDEGRPTDIILTCHLLQARALDDN
jgi:hypothetical protein